VGEIIERLTASSSYAKAYPSFKKVSVRSCLKKKKKREKKTQGERYKK
jgi:hypothetical protein